MNPDVPPDHLSLGQTPLSFELKKINNLCFVIKNYYADNNNI